MTALLQEIDNDDGDDFTLRDVPACSVDIDGITLRNSHVVRVIDAPSGLASPNFVRNLVAVNSRVSQEFVRISNATIDGVQLQNASISAPRKTFFNVGGNSTIRNMQVRNCDIYTLASMVRATFQADFDASAKPFLVMEDIDIADSTSTGGQAMLTASSANVNATFRRISGARIGGNGYLIRISASGSEQAVVNVDDVSLRNSPTVFSLIAASEASRFRMSVRNVASVQSGGAVFLKRPAQGRVAELDVSDITVRDGSACSTGLAITGFDRATVARVAAINNRCPSTEPATCVFGENLPAGAVTGIVIESEQLELSDVQVRGNVAVCTGGLLLRSNDATLRAIDVLNNTATASGSVGGMVVRKIDAGAGATWSATTVNVVDNTGDIAGGVSSDGVSIDVASLRLWNNEALSTDALSSGGWLHSAGDFAMRNARLMGNKLEQSSDGDSAAALKIDAGVNKKLTLEDVDVTDASVSSAGATVPAVALSAGTEQTLRRVSIRGSSARNAALAFVDGSASVSSVDDVCVCVDMAQLGIDCGATAFGSVSNLIVDDVNCGDDIDVTACAGPCTPRAPDIAAPPTTMTLPQMQTTSGASSTTAATQTTTDSTAPVSLTPASTTAHSETSSRTNSGTTLDSTTASNTRSTNVDTMTSTTGGSTLSTTGGTTLSTTDGTTTSQLESTTTSSDVEPTFAPSDIMAPSDSAVSSASTVLFSAIACVLCFFAQF